MRGKRVKLPDRGKLAALFREADKYSVSADILSQLYPFFNCFLRIISREGNFFCTSVLHVVK